MEPATISIASGFSIFVNKLKVFLFEEVKGFLCTIMSVHGQALAVVRRVLVFN